MHRIKTAVLTGTTLSLMTAANLMADPPRPRVDSCGYPNGAPPALSSVRFGEDNSLFDLTSGDVLFGGQIRAFYNGEHALTLGVRKVTVKTAAGATTTTDYSSTFTPFDKVTLSAVSTAGSLPVGSTALTGLQAATDGATSGAAYGHLDHGRPIFPALYVTDISQFPGSTLGDWQQSGSPVAPMAIFGTWRGAVKTVETNRNQTSVRFDADPDPAKNFWNGVPDLPPSGFHRSQGHGAELVWSVDQLGLVPGHTYRLQLIVHDGDEGRSGGQASEACSQITVGGGGPM